MRIFLILFSYINLFIYIVIYALFDYIIDNLGFFGITAEVQNFVKIVILIIIGFLIGLIIIFFMEKEIKKSYFSYRAFLLMGAVPFIFLILSEGTITNFIIVNFFGSDLKLTELAFYLFSRTTIWSLWFGFAVGTCIRVSFRKNLKMSKK